MAKKIKIEKHPDCPSECSDINAKVELPEMKKKEKKKDYGYKEHKK